MHLALHPILSWPLLAAGAVMAAAAVVWIYRGALAQASGRWRGIAFALRIAALVMLVAAMLRPALVFSEKRKQSASLIMLADHSRSMLVADAWDGLPRWRAMSQTLVQADGPLKKLADLLDIRQFQFDSKPTESLNLTEPPTGNQTAIGDVLLQAIRQAPGRVAAIVLLSDGANTSGTPPMSVAENLKGLGVPLYTVGFGQEAAVDASRDLALRTITAGPTVFEKNKLTVTGELDARGFAGQKVQVNLLFDGLQADSRTIELPQDDQRQKIELSYVPTTPGEHKVTLAVSELEPKKGELVETNNELSTFVTVLKGGLRVQYLDSGAGSWEPTLIRRALDTSADIKVDFIWVRGPIAEPSPRPVPEQVARGAQSEGGGGMLFDRTRYDVFLLRDVPRAWFPDAALERLERAVEAGAGLAMLGGRQSFGPGGYAGTPVADALPVTMHPGDRQISQPLPVVPTAQGLGHFVMRLGAEADTKRIWQSLPPLQGASSFSDVKPQGRVLAESSDHLPLIVAQDFGQGRSMAIAADSTWLWRLQSQHHRRFWRQVILWLARKEQAGESRVRVELAKRRVAAGEPLEVTARAEDEHGDPLTDATFQVMVTPPEGKPAPLQVLPQAERARATFYATQKAGDYEVSVVARRSGEALGPPQQAKFLVYEDESELTAPSADISLLARMAELTGGRYIQPERLSAFLEELRHQDLHLEVERLTHYRLWDNWPFLLVFVTLLTAEWGLRKWKGLV